VASAPGRITTADGHGTLGTAGEERLAALVEHLTARDPAAALADLDAAVAAGIDPALLIEQLFGYLRDCMAAAVGCPSQSFLYTSPALAGQVETAGKQLGLDGILARMQILDQTLSRMRYRTQGRILAELALVRIGHLEDFADLSDLIAQLQSGAAPAKKKHEPPLTQPSAVASEKETPPHCNGGALETGDSISVEQDRPEDAEPIRPENAVEIWNRALGRLSGMAVDQARHFDSVVLAAPDRLGIRFKPSYALLKTACQRPEQVARFEQALAETTGQRVRVEFALTDETESPAEIAPPARVVSPHQRLLEAAQHPLVHRACELFGAQPVRIDDSQSRE